MESKKLPVVYLELSPEGSVVWDDVGNEFKLVSGGVDRELLIPHLPVEPYIPARRVQAIIDWMGDDKYYEVAKSYLSDLIADVEDDGK